MPSAPPRPVRHRLRPLARCAWLLAVCIAATATPEKAARYYEVALQRYEQDDLTGAIAQLKVTLQEDPKMLAAHLLLGKALLRNGDPRAAQAALEQAARQGVSRADVALPLAQAYLAVGDPKRLLDEINGLGLPPAMQSDILMLRGSAYAMSNNISLATKTFAEARAADPKSALPLIAEAPFLLRLGDRDKARALAVKATEMAPANPNAWVVLGNILQALPDNNGALAAYEKALALNARHVDARVAHAWLLLNLNRDKEADADLAQLRNYAIVDGRASYLRAQLAQRRGDRRNANLEFGNAAALIDAVPAAVRANNEPLLMAGALTHRALGNPAKAREYLEALLSRNARHGPGQLLMASVLVELKEYSRAVPLLEGLRSAAPDDAQVNYLLGSVYLARKQYAQAVEYFEKSAARNPGPDVQRELGLSQLGLGQDRAALANLEKAFVGNNRDTRAGMELATVYARLGQPAKALATAETVRKTDPDSPAMLSFIGQTLALVGDLPGARDAYERALAKDPAFRQAIVNLSWLDIDAGRYGTARTRLQGLLKGNREDAEALYELGVLENKARQPLAAIAAWTRALEGAHAEPRAGLALIDLYAAQRQNDQALAMAKRMAAKFADSVPVQMALARSYFAAGDPNPARQALAEATKLAGFDPVLQVAIGRIQLQYGNPTGAAYNANKALQSKPDDLQALVLAVDVEMQRGNAAGVASALKTLTARHPDNPATLATGAAVALSRGQTAAAVAGYRAAMDKEPNARTLALLAQALQANKEGAKARALLEDWSAKHPGDLQSLKALADLQTAAGDSDGARKTFAQIVATDPNDPAALSRYASLLYTLGDPAAVAQAEKAYKLEPGNADYGDVYGWMLVQQGKLTDGLRVLREARLREPGHGLLRFHLAAALSKSGRKAEAREEMSAALASKATLPAEARQLKAELGL